MHTNRLPTKQPGVSSKPVTRLVMALLAASFVLIPAGLLATTTLQVDLAELGVRADGIVVGTVTDAKTVERSGAPFGIFTDTVLAIERVEKGTHMEELTIRLPGGTLPDGRSVRVDGVPRFEIGQRVLLVGQTRNGTRFGESAQRTYWVPLGLSQGVWTIERVDGVDVAKRHVTNIVLVTPDGSRVAPDSTSKKPLESIVEALMADVTDRGGEQ